MTKNIKFDIGELIDKLSVTQIKQLNYVDRCEEWEVGIKAITQEIDYNHLNSSGIYLTGNLVNLIVALAQINTFIWMYREKIAKSDKDLDLNIKISHQLNAIRNMAKNKLNLLLDNNNKIEQKLNVNKEDLKGWSYSIVED